MSGMWQDIRVAVRALCKAPAFTLLAIITVALGLGATTAIFSMVNGALLSRLPYASGTRLIRITQPSARTADEGFSVPEVADLRAQMPDFAAVAEYHSMSFQLYGRGEPQRVQTGVVSDDFFSMLGVHPVLGRLFRPGEEAIGAPPVVVLSYRYWVDRLGADSSVVGSTFTMNDKVHTVIGVLPPLPTYPDRNDIWMPAGACPFRSAPAMMHMRDGRMLMAFAALEPGVTVERARGDLALLARRLHAAYPDAYPATARLELSATSLSDELTRGSRPLLLTLLATAAFVLIVAAANLANLMLARQLRRAREVAVRTALGAGRGRLFRQLAAESLCITVTGGVLGVLIAYSGMGLLRTFATRVTPRAAEIGIDPVVLAVAFVLSVLVGIGAALAPILRVPTSLGDALREGSAATTASRRGTRGRNLLVAAQVAVAFVLLVGAGLMARSLMLLQRVDGGYDTAGVLTARVDHNFTRYDTEARIRDFADRLMARLDGQRGIASVALASDFPLNNAQPSAQPFEIEGRSTPAGERTPRSDVTVVTPAYFATMRIPVMRGRVFTQADRDTANVPVVIGHRLASTYWSGRDPSGSRISFDGGRNWGTVVGVVGDVRQNELSQDITDEVYVPFAIVPTRDIRVLVRAVHDPRPLASAIGAAVHELDAMQPVVSVQTLDELRGLRLTEPRVTTVLLVAFAVIALVITAAGLSGVIGYAVNQRVSEIGIRIALGADPARVLWLVVRDGLATVVVGLVVGIAGALAVTRLMARLLYSITPTDGVTYAVVVGVLLAIATAACLIPVRRALRVDPARALRAR
jgi:predicted permease